MELLNKLISKRTQGSLYEQKARVYLEAQGLRFIAANQSFKCGELDLIMQQGETLVFVEVRQRKSNRFGSAVESIDYRKQQKWLNAANMWLATKRKQSLETANCRFDVVAFEGEQPPLWIPNFLG
ncbi:YraN family protein [Actinobacillus minor]|uniref:YraN family protein n=1 Tax=Actinobacillus minor TaxID=51047 RepID=UPI0023EFF6E8|nr:YraN family protein [Actinobacillus minor]MDD6910703.1 YraN family protein [Actinobacillus minor]MDY4713119.1 YraN family protein [Actinobacillus minor]